jgi:hypothetical protein
MSSKQVLYSFERLVVELYMAPTMAKLLSAAVIMSNVISYSIYAIKLFGASLIRLKLMRGHTDERSLNTFTSEKGTTD